MKMCNDNVFQYPCPVCGDMIESTKGCARKYCDECLKSVRASQSLVGARVRIGWQGKKVYENIDPRIVKVVFGVDI